MSCATPSSDHAVAPVVLAIETSTEIGSVALVRGGTALTEAHHVGGPELSAWVLPAIERLLREHRLARPDAVACGIGPGAFTGVRTACATAQALAWGWSVPLHAVGSLDAFLLAQFALATAEAEWPIPGRWAVLMDARQAETYATVWDVGETTCHSRPTRAQDGVAGPPAALATMQGLRRVIAPTLVADASLAAWLGEHCVKYALGSACAKLGHARPHCLPALRLERVLKHGALGVGIAATLPVIRVEVDPPDLQPHYVRDRVALTEAEREAERRAKGPPDRGGASHLPTALGTT